MKSRNALLAAGMALVAVALVAPATAGATERWWFDHKQGRFPTVEVPKEDEPNISAVYLTDKKGIKYGPCEKLVVKGTLWNKFGGMGEGNITGIFESGYKECPVSTVKKCKVVKFEPLTTTPWSLTLNSDNTVLVTNFAMTVELEGECGEAELPKESTVSGTVEASKTKFIPYVEGEGEVGPAISFEKAQVGTTGIYLDGTMNFGTFLTSPAEEPSGFKAEQSPAKLDGSEMGSFYFTRGGDVVQCDDATLTGTAKDKDTTLTVAPVYENCKTELGPATVDMNGCTYLLHVEAEFIEAQKYTYRAPTDLKCPKEEEMEIDIFVGETEHESGKPFCRFGLSPTGNEGLEAVELTHKAPKTGEGPTKGWIEADVEIEGITSKLLKGSMIFCGAEVDTAGRLDGKYQVTGTTEEGAIPNGIAVFPS